VRTRLSLELSAILSPAILPTPETLKDFILTRSFSASDTGTCGIAISCWISNGLKLLAQAGLVFESANPDTDLIHALVNISEHVPDLRIVVDHLPHASVPAEKTANEEYWSELRTLSQNPRVFVKLSEIPVRVHGKLVIEPGNYKGSLDALWNIFGEDRVLFGSDWPNSDHIATYAQTFRIVREYISGKSTAAAEKFFWKNSFAAYRWRPRSANQTLPG